MSTVLIVEDDPDDETLFLRALRKCEGAPVFEVVRDGRAAVDRLLSGEALPRFVLLDLKLPKLSGHEVLEAVRAEHDAGTLPVVVFSSSDEPSDIELAYAKGANSYVTKPVASSAFAATARYLARFWSEHNQPVLP